MPLLDKIDQAVSSTNWELYVSIFISLKA
jgi:hypothetical protein